MTKHDEWASTVTSSKIVSFYKNLTLAFSWRTVAILIWVKKARSLRCGVVVWAVLHVDVEDEDEEEKAASVVGSKAPSGAANVNRNVTMNTLILYCYNGSKHSSQSRQL
jgi:hypothetical protein